MKDYRSRNCRCNKNGTKYDLPAVLGPATGNSPVKVAGGGISFGNVITCNLDKYYPLQLNAKSFCEMENFNRKMSLALQT